MRSALVHRRMMFRMRPVRSLLLVSLLFFVVACMLGAQAQVQTGLIPDSGRAVAKISESRLSLANQALRVEWTTNAGKVKFAGFEDLFGMQNLALPNELFVVRLKNGS